MYEPEVYHGCSLYKSEQRFALENFAPRHTYAQSFVKTQRAPLDMLHGLHSPTLRHGRKIWQHKLVKHSGFIKLLHTHHGVELGILELEQRVALDWGVHVRRAYEIVTLLRQIDKGPAPRFEDGKPTECC
jgi:hypothetical protein